MQAGSYFMSYSGLDFKEHVKDKFKKVVSKDISNVELEKAIKKSRIVSLVPNITLNQKVDKRCKLGIAIVTKFLAVPAHVGTPLSHVECENLKSYIKAVGRDYHNAQSELLRDHLHIQCDDKGFMLKANEKGKMEYATTIELAQEIDKQSCSVMEARGNIPNNVPPADDYDNLTKKIELCYKVLVLRLWNHLYHVKNVNDVMDVNGEKAWRNHTLIMGSFAVYILSLQLDHKRKYGSFYTVLSVYEATKRKTRDSQPDGKMKRYLYIGALGVLVLAIFFYIVSSWSNIV